ncbi:hypothetical protein E2C01_025466 [Portunus trituberculatus]|uniref:Uncharacterized protein n=1 Tax=Portunus trituberculatus TaxID=210409 RepID=A0A5B7ED00_PORTR|nr:hypothetical protein [Portunus trituberculatus]
MCAKGTTVRSWRYRGSRSYLPLPPLVCLVLRSSCWRVPEYIPEEEHLGIRLVISVALENSLGERSKRL